ncbi:MAG: polysaccharide deacetylase family protein [Caulobacteraceae bacterium]|nr:polysaccharide deacetylase family protein [Caulobacteraceae bacterium]
MTTEPAYSADRSLRGKLRRRLVRGLARRPARLNLDRPMVTFTFDDAPDTAVTNGAKVLEAHGARGSYYVSTSLAGGEGPMGRYATREALMAVAARGHELACHTANHLDCGQARAAQILAEVDANAEAFKAWGAAPATQFAYPYGDVSLDAKRALGGRFKILRALHKGLIETGTDLNQAPAIGIEGARGEDMALRWLKRARDRKAWLLLYTHDVCETPSPWGSTPQVLGALIEAAKSMDFEIVTLSEGSRRLLTA